MIGNLVGAVLFGGTALGIGIYVSFKSQPAQWWLRRKECNEHRERDRPRR